MLKIISGDTEYKFGTITSFTDSFSKSVAVTPIVSLPTECAFPLETGATLSYSVSFTRISPVDYNDQSDDSDNWCNATWVERVSTLADRWQMRSDGYELQFSEADDDTENPYVPVKRDRVYIKNLSFSADAGFSDTLTGSMQLRVGTIRTGSALPAPIDGYDIPHAEPKIALAGSYVVMTSPDLQKLYLLQYGGWSNGEKDYDVHKTVSVDCINSYSVTGGPAVPFENVQLRISRKRLTELYPELGEAADSTFSTDILAGRSRIRFRGMGTGEMVVTNCKMTSDEYTITAYCRAEVYRGQPLNTNLTNTPLECIRYILTEPVFGALFSESQIKTYGLKDVQTTISFLPSTTCWQALQICAGILNAKIFFADNCAYVVNFCEGPNLFAPLELYPEGGYSNVMYGRVVGQTSYGNEGQDTIINIQTISCGTDNEGDAIIKTSEDKPSTTAYSRKEGQSIDISKYINTENAAIDGVPDAMQNLCDHIVQYASEPQKSITFQVKEQSSEGGGSVWTPVFPTCMCVSRLSSSVDGISISNETTITRTGNQTARPQKLYLSEYTRQYPKMITEYTFGVISWVDLQDTLSKIR